MDKHSALEWGWRVVESGYFRDRGIENPQERHQLFERAITPATPLYEVNSSGVDY